MRMLGGALLSVALTAFFLVSVHAAPPPPMALSITSDRLEMDDKTQVAVFLGHVVADNGRMRLSASRMTVYYDKKRKPGAPGGGVREVKAEGQVTIQEDKNKGKADVVNYQIDKRILELVGKESDASIQHGDDLLTGRRILVTLDHEHQIGKVMVQGAENHRVSARITPSGLLQRVETPLRETPASQKPANAQKEPAQKPKEGPEFSVPSPDVWSKEPVKGAPEQGAGKKEEPAAKPVAESEVDPKETVTGLKETVAGWKETVAGWKENATATGEGVDESADTSKGGAPTPRPRRRSPSWAAPKR